MHMSPARPRPAIRLATLGLAALAPLAMLAAAQPAAANPPGPHDPFGAVRAVKSVTDGIRFTGWAADPDALTTNVTVGLLLDGRKWVASAPTSVANATVSNTYKTGP